MVFTVPTLVLWWCFPMRRSSQAKSDSSASEILMLFQQKNVLPGQCFDARDVGATILAKVSASHQPWSLSTRLILMLVRLYFEQHLEPLLLPDSRTATETNFKPLSNAQPEENRFRWISGTYKTFATCFISQLLLWKARTLMSPRPYMCIHCLTISDSYTVIGVSSSFRLTNHSVLWSICDPNPRTLSSLSQLDSALETLTNASPFDWFLTAKTKS